MVMLDCQLIKTGIICKPISMYGGDCARTSELKSFCWSLQVGGREAGSPETSWEAMAEVQSPEG